MEIKIALLTAVALAAGTGVAHADPTVDFYALSRDLDSYGIVPNAGYDQNKVMNLFIQAEVTLVDFCDWLESDPGYFGTSKYGGPTDSDVVEKIKRRIENPTPGKVHALGALATAYYCPAQRGKLDGVMRSSEEKLLSAAASAGTWQRVANNGNINDWRLVIS